MGVERLALSVAEAAAALGVSKEPSTTPFAAMSCPPFVSGDAL